MLLYNLYNLLKYELAEIIIYYRIISQIADIFILRCACAGHGG